MIYRFGDCELDEARSELRRAGRGVALQPKPLGLLALLIRERHRVVAKDELLDALWPDAVVTESSLTRAVSLARRAIGDRGDRARIRSYARRGYRFVGHVSELEQTRPAAGAAPSPDLAPTELARAGDDPFVGRAEHLGRLHEAWHAAASGRGRITLLQGDAGIGKSRLADTFAGQLAADGQRVLHARSDESGGAPAFWMWAQVLRGLADAVDLRAVAEEIGPSAWDVASLVPELGERPEAPAQPPASPEQSRFLFFDAVTRILLRSASEAPLVVVLEDLHQGTRESLLLLEHLAPQIRDAQILLVATVRETARERGDPLSRALAQLGRLAHVELLGLSGFGAAEVEALLHQRIGRPPPARLVAELLERTEGNPLFVREAIRLLADRGALDFPEAAPRWDLSGLPSRILDVVRSSLEQLTPACARVLDAAAVTGRSFSAPLVADVAGVSREDVLDAFDEAVLAGVVREEEGPAGGFRFAHPLYHEVACASLPPGRRARLHLRTAECLEKQWGAAGAALSEIAHHRHQSLSVGDPQRAHQMAVRAAERALASVAYEEAALHYEQALAALDMLGSQDEQRFETLLSLGRAHRFAGDRSRRRAVLRGAIDHAREQGDDPGLARAVVGFCDMSEWAARDEEGEGLVHVALERLSPEPGVLRTRLLSRLAYLGRRRRGEAEPRAREALAMARESGEPDALQEALYTLHLVLAGPDDFPERATLVQEMVEVAPRSSYRDLAIIGLIDIASDRLTLGDLEGALRERHATDVLAGDAPHRGIQWNQAVFDTGVALLRGRFERVEQAIRETYSLGRSVEHPYATMCFAGHTLALLRDRGGLVETAERVARSDPGDALPGFYSRAIPVEIYARRGRAEKARALFAVLVDEVLPTEPHGIDWLCALAELSAACVTLRDEKRAGALAEHLRPYDALHAVTPVAVCYSGPIAHHLGGLAALCGELSEAEERFEDAVARCDALGARAAGARARLELGRVLRRRGREPAARAMLTQAQQDASALGMTDLSAAAAQEVAG